MELRRPKQGGFSLIELVVVVGILGTLLAIAFPAMSSFVRSSRLTGASNTLVGDLRYARSLANSQHRTYTIVFSSGSYKVQTLSPITTVLTRTLPRGVTCAASDTATFYAWGLTDPVTISVSNGSTSSAMQLSANGSVVRD